MADYKHKHFSNWEKTYWKFRVVQFQRQLHDNSGEALVLPETFVENVTEKLAKKVTLKTSSGSNWTIGLETGRDGNLFLRDGWKEFVKSHYLKKNDTLIFKYTGDSKFNVTMFDGDTSTEKACSHFVHNALHVPVTEIHQNDRNDSAIKRRTECNRSANDDGDSELHLARNKNSMRTHSPTGNLTSARKRTNSTSARKRTRGDCSDHSGRLAKERDGDLRYPGCQNNRQANERSGTKERDGESRYPGCQNNRQANKRNGTDLVMKQRANYEDGLEVYMHPSYVHPRYYVSLSKIWAQEQNIVESQEGLLHKDGKIWEVKIYIRQKIVGMDRGRWKAFVDENNLQKGDQCYFSVIPGSRDPIKLDVCIIRADDGDDDEEGEADDEEEGEEEASEFGCYL